MSLPMLNPSDRSVRPNNSTSTASHVMKGSVKAKESDQTAVVKALCKTYAHTTQKLMYAFAALSEEKSGEVDACSVSEALERSARAVLIDHVTSALAAGVEKVIRNADISMRSMVLRDLRARFTPQDRPECLEKGCQASSPREKKSKAIAHSEAVAPELSEAAAPAVRPKVLPSRDAEATSDSSACAASEKAQVNAVAPGEQGSATPNVPQGGAMTVAIYERLRAWEARKQERVDLERQRREEKEQHAISAAVQGRKSGVKYSHVQSAIKAERKKEEDNKLAQAEQRVEAEAQQRIQAERRLEEEAMQRQQIESDLEHSEHARLCVQEELDRARAQIKQAERKCAQLQQEANQHNEAREILEALDGKTFEAWPMVPNRKVLRVNDSEEFDGRVSAEYRVKDMESDERGVSLLMGRSVVTKQSEVQCVLFDPKYMSDLQAARWWAANRRRFDMQAARMRARSAPRRNGAVHCQPS